MVRSPEKIQQFSAYPSIEWIDGDLADHDALCMLVADADVVVHCAGSVRGLSKADFYQANANGVAHLLQAIHEQRVVARFLLISSLVAREPHLSHYASSKLAGESHLIASAGKIQWSIFRPAAVYGPGDRELRPLFDLMRFGILLQLGHSQARFSLLHVSDLVAAVVAWIKSVDVHSSAIELHDGRRHGYSWGEIRSIAQTAYNKRLLTLIIPESVLKSIALLASMLARWTESRPMLSMGKVKELRHDDWVCVSDMDAAIPEWKPKVTFSCGLHIL